MSKKTIMLICNAGMSTSMLVTKMQKAAEAEGLDIDIFATAAADATNKLQERQIDTVLLGPQVRFMQKQFEEKLTPLGIPVDVINMTDYGMMNGEKVLGQAITMIQN
ncbi:PTS sugar transporter subunit IIB [Enterococcus pseudoavium]|uniref:PTS sugar transporter subunit IIB n=1 Tax=Enterococcus pseudoavium TaxID=44007 RepID=A0AAE4I3G5_9ENTE|nr:PTS sugar transporter subunit IIB [Enterococcus pseudoavium]MDT2737280.1 PTS sugar transporter subunit IIB [Enterococcus pseudoavium]MDT2755670.1 PTS sugar transporter subunit IIB [Enterococcus pseudoavium]MDT2771624.1 PTS sugar transporter subunit IIB [Enterococcus pseudoavium]REC33037.1 PTS sugar transporter subunit IIB [Enterococcus pseudoavium]